MKIDEIIIKLCELDSRDEMELYLEEEIEKVESVEDCTKLTDYICELHDIYGYLRRGKYRRYKPCYQQLMDMPKVLK